MFGNDVIPYKAACPTRGSKGQMRPGAGSAWAVKPGWGGGQARRWYKRGIVTELGEWPNAVAHTGADGASPTPRPRKPRLRKRHCLPNISRHSAQIRGASLGRPTPCWEGGRKKGWATWETI